MSTTRADEITTAPDSPWSDALEEGKQPTPVVFRHMHYGRYREAFGSAARNGVFTSVPDLLTRSSGMSSS